MKQIQIFKTNIGTQAHVQTVTELFQTIRHVQEWTVDMEDCDRVLRIITLNFPPQATRALLKAKNIHCEPMACFTLDEA